MPPTDQITIRRAVNGDESALRAIWTQHAPRIDALVRRLVGDPDQAADVAQEVWIQIFRALPGYRGDSQFSTWAHRIAVNRTLNALRSLRRVSKAEVDIEEDSFSVEHDGDRSMLAQTIDEAVQKLSPGDGRIQAGEGRRGRCRISILNVSRRCRMTRPPRWSRRTSPRATPARLNS